MEKITLEYFRNLNGQEQCDLLNQLSEGKKTLTQLQKDCLAFTNVGQQLKDGVIWSSKKKTAIYNTPPSLTTEEILELKKMLQDKKEKPVINRFPADDTIKTRSVLVYENAYKDFAAWCKENKIPQQEAIYIATQQLMQNYNK